MAAAAVELSEDWEARAAAMDENPADGAAPQFSPVYPPDFATSYEFPEGVVLFPPHVRLGSRRPQRALARQAAAWGGAGGKSGARPTPRPTLEETEWPRSAPTAKIVRGENAWVGGTHGPKTPDLRGPDAVRQKVRTIVNKIPSCSAIRRNIEELYRERDELNRARARDKELKPVLDRIEEQRDALEGAKKTRERFLRELIAVPVEDGESVSTFIEAFVQGVLPAHSVIGGGQVAERSLFEGPAQMCCRLANPEPWGDVAAEEARLLEEAAGSTSPAATAGTPSPASGELVDFVAWGPKTFLRALRTFCQRRFLSATTDEIGPYVTLVGHLIRVEILPPRKFVPITQRVLAARLIDAADKAEAEPIIHQMRSLLEIVNESFSHDGALFEKAEALFRAISKTRRLPDRDFELSARSVSEAQIFLEKRRGSKKGRNAPRRKDESSWRSGPPPPAARRAVSESAKGGLALPPGVSRSGVVSQRSTSDSSRRSTSDSSRRRGGSGEWRDAGKGRRERGKRRGRR
jgi:hypothetical protein